jgi:hypothetical protein
MAVRRGHSASTSRTPGACRTEELAEADRRQRCPCDGTDRVTHHTRRSASVFEEHRARADENISVTLHHLRCPCSAHGEAVCRLPAQRQRHHSGWDLLSASAGWSAHRSAGHVEADRKRYPTGCVHDRATVPRTRKLVTRCVHHLLVRVGDRWRHANGLGDDSKDRHAREHFHVASRPIAISVAIGERGAVLRRWRLRCRAGKAVVSANLLPNASSPDAFSRRPKCPRRPTDRRASGGASTAPASATVRRSSPSARCGTGAIGRPPRRRRRDLLRP